MRILRDKLVRLGKGEDGAALIVTLALFMFMYLSCAGVFAVGQQVKNRIHLQNACDAAAYSAAVVQADTLSRIATINRAMAWTYISMSRRQMDYIVYKWLEEACKHHEDDENAAREYARNNCSWHQSKGHGWNIDDMMLNGHSSKTYSRDVLESAYGSGLPSHMAGAECSQSFYSQATSLDGLGSQIDDDLESIEEMGNAERDLANQMNGRIKSAVGDILAANVPAAQQELCMWFLDLHVPLDDYMRELCNVEEDELRFVNFAYDGGLATSTKNVFEAGSGNGQWFVRDGNAEGIRRAYREDAKILRAEWTWWSTKRVCEYDPDHHDVSSWAHAGNCTHGGHTKCMCTTSDNGTSVKSVSYADNSVNFDGGETEDRFRSLRGGEKVFARPLILTEDYFGAAGTITVGLACRNENPWYRIFKNSAEISKGILGGIYGAFNPYKDVDWTWTFSSAKAGYKFTDEDLDRRDYVVHWDKDDQDWNLCQSDWDAVFVPVRRAVSKATKDEDGVVWTFTDSAPLDDWINEEWKPLGSGSWSAVASMADLPGMHDSGGAGGLKWKDLADMLYH